MPARRRASSTRDAITRFQMWDKKMNAEVYSEYLKATKPLALPKVAGYQATHEYLISKVKSALQEYPEEYHILQEYMWYAEKLWKLTQTYGSEALKKEANSIFIWYLARGRNEMALRKIAYAMGIKIEDTDVIIEEMTMKIVAKDTITADGTERTILEYMSEIGAMTKISGYIDLSNMASGDIVEVKAYTKISPDEPYRLYRIESFSGVQTEPAIYFLPRLSGYAFKITLRQTQGTYKSFRYVFVRGG